MPKTARSTVSFTAAPVAVAPNRPPRMDLLDAMLAGTQRAGVPIRRAFLQTVDYGPDDTRAASLSHLLRAPGALDAYLLIAALASSSEPYAAKYPAATWAQIAGLLEAAELPAGKAHWSRVVSKLVDEKLVARQRIGNDMNYVLLHESGDGLPYTRPTTAAHGNWFSLPHAYWLEGYDQDMSLPEKVMLLIALDRTDGFVMPSNRVARWYGVSEKTAERGFHGLVDRGILGVASKQAIEPKSPTGWKTVLSYTTLGQWSIESRNKAMKAGNRRKPKFTSPSAPEEEA
jgi:hypothetical protein